MVGVVTAARPRLLPASERKSRRDFIEDPPNRVMLRQDLQDSNRILMKNLVNHVYVYVLPSKTISPLITVITQRVFNISGAGIVMMSAERIVRSASLPTSIEPRSLSSNAAYAGQIVNILSACSRVTASSGCQPSAENPFWSLRATAA